MTKLHQYYSRYNFIGTKSLANSQVKDTPHMTKAEKLCECKLNKIHCTKFRLFINLCCYPTTQVMDR